jgi:hypothetical protein
MPPNLQSLEQRIEPKNRVTTGARLAPDQNAAPLVLQTLALKDLSSPLFSKTFPLFQKLRPLFLFAVFHLKS